MKKLKDFKPLDKDQMKIVKVGDKFYSEMADPPKTCTGCEQTTPYGGCYIFQNECVWIPEFGA